LHRDDDSHQKIYGQSEKEVPFLFIRGKNEMSKKMLSQSFEYRDLQLHHLKKIQPAFHESYDFPL